ncbi:MAG: hypothetical protein ABIH34_02795 [Nanoarchaeota archaeon]
MASPYTPIVDSFTYHKGPSRFQNLLTRDEPVQIFIEKGRGKLFGMRHNDDSFHMEPIGDAENLTLASVAEYVGHCLGIEINRNELPIPSNLEKELLHDRQVKALHRAIKRGLQKIS